MKKTTLFLLALFLVAIIMWLIMPEIIARQSDNSTQSQAMEKNTMSQNEDDWKQKLTPEQYHVLREKGTERPFTGQYLNNKSDGVYRCGACGNPIFTSDTKFDSGSGWPSFDQAIPNSIKLTKDNSHGMQRIEVTCAKCGSHLGHLFNDGPTESGERFCINSVSLGFEPIAKSALELRVKDNKSF